jgi:hypothetical protein
MLDVPGTKMSRLPHQGVDHSASDGERF